MLSTIGMQMERRRCARRLVAFVGLACVAWQCHAQKPVYRCETQGRVSYSDAPCVGAREVDATPTLGVDRVTGARRRGAEVLRDERRAVMAEALKPLTGWTPERYRLEQHRARLSPRDQAECRQLDAHLPNLKQRAAQATPEGKARAEVELFRTRQQFHDLGC